MRAEERLLAEEGGPSEGVRTGEVEQDLHEQSAHENAIMKPSVILI